jgi:fumarate hydratase subunit alpha
MRKINYQKIKDVVSQLCIEANSVLRPDILFALKRACRGEKNKKAKEILKILLDNANIARAEKLPICQDTGMAVVFVEIGNNVQVVGGSLGKAIHKGVREGYRRGYLRKSICEPLIRKNTQDNTPAIIHYRIVKGDRLKITVCAKGFGAENKSQIKMFEPTATLKEIKEFILTVVKEAGPDACPPFVVGVGIGGTFEKAALLAEEATLEKVKSQKSKIKITNQNAKIYKLEQELLHEINKLNIGPMGLGGRTTALGVNIFTYPTHIAGLPVAVNISCHARRSASKSI